MTRIAFFDTEICPNTERVLDIGGVDSSGRAFHHSSVGKFVQFLKGNNFVCGHNVLRHDVTYVGDALAQAGIAPKCIIDTLYWSPLLFPAHPYHRLVKDDKLDPDGRNNPLNDSKKAQQLFQDECDAFLRLPADLKKVFYGLLHDQKEFSAFFTFLGWTEKPIDLQTEIRQLFAGAICQHANLGEMSRRFPVELAYSLALIYANKRHSITPLWLIKNYTKLESIYFLLRNKPCKEGCSYCLKALNALNGLKKFFGFDAFRSFDGRPMQEEAVQAALKDESLLAVFPTGAGKSVTFQLPALMSGVNTKGLTVVISPLQSLMKDQVDNLERKDISEAVTINGLLDPLERANAMERVANGLASILYISPESLRSRTIERLILGRNIARFVVDEAHCLSSWGQDFRVDYLFIAPFIKRIQDIKQLGRPIPVSCFTATAKPNVIEDIQKYFESNLNLRLKSFVAKSARVNLKYVVYSKEDEGQKYQAVRDIIEEKDCPTIIYVSRTKLADALAQRLSKDGFSAKPYHGRMEKAEKSANQDAFLDDRCQIMVATSAFGMGVDKKDVGTVIHYDISDSLENYLQEAGRAGRDELITADCYVLFNEEDLNKHFILLNQTKLTLKEIQQVWSAIRGLTKFRSTFSNSALEIAREAGWDDSVYDLETRVKSAIAALEDAGYLRRGQNYPVVYADSILAKTAMQAIDQINASKGFSAKEKEIANQVIRKLISAKRKHISDQDPGEARIDYISDLLGLERKDVIRAVNLLRAEKILGDTKDLTAFTRRGVTRQSGRSLLFSFNKLETFLFKSFINNAEPVHIKALKQAAEEGGNTNVSLPKMKTIINFWIIKDKAKRKVVGRSLSHQDLDFTDSKEVFLEKMNTRHGLATFFFDYFYTKLNPQGESNNENENLIEFSVLELKAAYEGQHALFKEKVSIEAVEEALFYLSRIGVLTIEGGFIVLYNRLTIERLNNEPRKRYTTEDYKKLKAFYEHRLQQIHIVGEYAKIMIKDYEAALQFVEDYFELNYSTFLRKYFPRGKVDELKLRITPSKFQQLFGELSPTQLKVIQDNESQTIVVAAGPGSGKTKLLVHKLAALLLMEDVKHDQLLMVTFSRAAASEFKKRLRELIGNAANYIEIKTFHSYCFDLLGKLGTLQESEHVVREATNKIHEGAVELSQITKTVLVIDEAQDMDQHEFNLVQRMMEKNENLQVIAVGDDDQNIFGFRGASSKYLQQLIVEHGATRYDLLENYRSKRNLVQFSDAIVQQLSTRLKTTPIQAKQSDYGGLNIHHFRSDNLLIPAVNDILRTPLSGTTAVLTKTNEEALLVASMLLDNGVNAKLIQSYELCNLYDLVETRFFLEQLALPEAHVFLDAECLSKARSALVNRFKGSAQLAICLKMIDAFEQEFPGRKYKSDLEVFIQESRFEDFAEADMRTIIVSTIHKIKGKEFDNVFLILQRFKMNDEDSKRPLYVAITRAKQNLSIYTDSNFFNQIQVPELKWQVHSEHFAEPTELILQLTFKDVWLDFFQYRQREINQLSSGAPLFIVEEDYACLHAGEKKILKFSEQFIERLQTLKSKNYIVKSAKANFILFWLKVGAECEIKIILPELRLVKHQSTAVELGDPTQR